MTPSREIEIKDFARRVERLCDFILAHEDKVKNESKKEKDEELKDLAVIQDLKEEAADIQFDRVSLGFKIITGLDDYMNGINIPSKES